MCEDYPCCGHTDGLGCDWVSPNEVRLCMVCADARANYPYHDGHSCKTADLKARENVPDGAMCGGTVSHPMGNRDECEEDAEANLLINGQYWCYSCRSEFEAQEAEYASMYN